MKRFRAFTLLVALTLPPALVAQSATPGADAVACRAFVQNFYNWYIAHGTNFENAMKFKQAVLSNDLKEALLADLAASRKSPDENVGLDFDPFVNSQDPAPHYRVGKTTVKEGTCWAEVHAVPATDKTSKPDATAEVRPEGGNWKFVNFHYGSDNGAENENLVSILRRLKRDREHAKGK
jgi:hypothetical protein